MSDHKLYQHHKGMFYKYLGVVKHSETLEDLVLYETLYENKLAKDWVRPKEMFFEKTQSQEGSTVPRFKKVDLEIRALSNPADKDLLKVQSLLDIYFPDKNLQSLLDRLKDKKNIMMHLAVVVDKVIGFKLGYEESSEIYYSWLGAVLPEFQQAGVAATLMQGQHKDAESKGYRVIRCKTLNKYQSMLILSLKQGFHIKGIDAEQKILLEKRLTHV